MSKLTCVRLVKNLFTPKVCEFSPNVPDMMIQLCRPSFSSGLTKKTSALPRGRGVACTSKVRSLVIPNLDRL